MTSGSSRRWMANVVSITTTASRSTVSRRLANAAAPATTISLSRRTFHSTASSTFASSTATTSTTPSIPTLIETTASRWVQSRHNPNVQADVNLGLTFALLAHAQQTSPHTNVVFDPLAIAQLLRNNAAARDALKKALGTNPNAAELDRYLDVDMSKLATTSSSPLASYVTTSPTTSSFNGVFAPRFAIADTATPAWFIPSSAAAAASSGTSPKRIGANMIYKCGKLWYCENATTQVVDVPYLSPDHLFTVVMPRVNDEPTIDSHPSPVYQALPRTPQTIAQVIAQLSPAQFLHDAAHRQLMTGFFTMPTFAAEHTLQLGSSSSSTIKHSSKFACSSEGLEVGGVRMPRFKGEQAPPTFVMSCHRPFIWFVRHRPTNAILLCGKVEQPQQRHLNVRYTQRRVQWIEDADPIAQFAEERDA